MIILNNALLLSFDERYEFGKYSLLIDEACVTDIAKQEVAREGEKTKLQKWIEQYGSQAEIIDCSSKIIMPGFVNSCVKSEGSLVKYLLRNRHYELTNGDLYTDFIFNYLYQEVQTNDMRTDLANIYRYSFAKNLKSGICFFNEFSLRKDANHLEPIASASRMTGQKVSVCYPIKQDEATVSKFLNLSPSYFITDEGQLNIYDISLLCELKKIHCLRLFLEVSTNKDVSEKFVHNFGKPVVKLLDEYGLIDNKTSLINPLYLSYDELRIISDKQANVIVCPQDLVHFTTRYFPIDDFINRGVRYSIGTGWLGEDLLDELRIFRTRYKELNIPNSELLKAITQVPAGLYFASDSHLSSDFSVSPGKPANLIFIDLTDLRFQFMPESSDFEHLCTFVVDNLAPVNISDVMIGGDFKVRKHKVIHFDEEEILAEAERTRNRLYKVAKYEEITERKKQRKSVEMLDLRSRDVDEIKLFSEGLIEKTSETPPEAYEEFRIKTKIPVFKHRVPSAQKSLFEETQTHQVVQTQQYQESPVLNLLYTEIEEAKGVEDEVLRSKIVDDKILKQVKDEKSAADSQMQNAESKVELPKNVKLKFGDD
jgi:cytosine/adenosine deaminase-related metal-dependent hydrolase